VTPEVILFFVPSVAGLSQGWDACIGMRTCVQGTAELHSAEKEEDEGEEERSMVARQKRDAGQSH